jgi:glycosyltransferase involved in cell wall biosynthesis/SAM-dependent methyltransferase
MAFSRLFLTANPFLAIVRVGCSRRPKGYRCASLEVCPDRIQYTKATDRFDPGVVSVTSTRLARHFLLGCYFPRSIDLEGVGSLARGLAATMVEAGWHVRVILPAGTNWSVAGTEASFVRPGLPGMRDYERAIRHLSTDADVILIAANNPAMVPASSASARPDSTFYLFLSPLNSLGVIREMGLCRQALVHAVGKNWLIARLHAWSGKRCIVGSHYQALQLRNLGAGEIHEFPVVGLSRTTPVPDREESRRRMGWSAGPIVGYLGHFSPAKGVESLVQAFGHVSPEYRLALAHSGKGALSRQAVRQLEDLRQQRRLLEHGEVDASVFLAACNLVALPYLTSSIFHLPQVMLESFASSTPVVSTRVGGIPEIVEAENLGLIVPPHDPVALAEALGRLLADPQSTFRMGQRARRLFEERLCTEAFLERFQGLIHSPGPTSRLKRDAWAVQAGTETYVRKMGSYALARDAKVVGDMIGRGPGRLLDIPCGTGRNFNLTRGQGYHVVGADFSPTMLRVARGYGGVPLVRADAFAPPFAREIFDTILMPRLLFHYANPESIIAGLLPTLKPGGRMVFDTLNTFSTRWLASMILQSFRDTARRNYYENPRGFAQKLASLGLEVTRCESAYVLPTRLYRFLPGPFVRLVHAAERLIPKRFRVLTFWQVSRRLSIS